MSRWLGVMALVALGCAACGGEAPQVPAGPSGAGTAAPGATSVTPGAKIVAYGYNGTDELPLVERFFLGGRFSVRGYEQDTLGPKGADNNPTGGNAFAMGSVGLRTNIGRGFSIVPFLDFGNVWTKVSDFTPSDIKYTAGLGLRYGTPVGPLRVDYGHKLNKEKDESNGELHFSIGHAF